MQTIEPGVNQEQSEANVRWLCEVNAMQTILSKVQKRRRTIQCEVNDSTAVENQFRNH